MAKNNKICLNCGKKYSYCPSCLADNNKPSWMNTFCSENCKDLFQTATDYFAGEITPGRAKAILNKLDTSNTDIKPSVLRMIDELKDVAPEEVAEAEIQPEIIIPEEVSSEEIKSDFEASGDVIEASDENIDMLGGIEVISTNPDKKFNKKNKRNKFDTDEN